MRRPMTANVRWPKILRVLSAAVAASALFFILLHLALSTHPVSASVPLQSSPWSTHIDSEQDSGDDEYGYEDNDLGGNGDSSASLAVSASLSPDPSTVNFRPDGSWHRFTVNSSGTVRVYTNPGTTPLNVEVNTGNSGNHCSNGAEREYKSRSNGQSVYLAGCQSGTGTVQLQTSSGTVIRTYTFSIGSGGGTNPTPVPTSVPTQPPSATASLSPDPSTVNFRAIRNQWHRFTVQSSAQVKVIANPTGSRRNVEINTSDPGKTHCAPEWSDTKTRSNGQYIYLEGCVSGTGTVELRRASDNALLRTYTFSIGSGGGTNPTPVPTQPPSASASLSPDPSTVNFRPDGTWRRFTVNSSGSIRVYVNPGSTPLNVEVNTSNSGSHCSNGAEREYKSRSNGQSVYLAGCQSGTGTVQLRTSSGTVIRTYTFSIGSGGGTNPTPIPTPVPTQPPSSTASLSPDPSTVNIRAVRDQWHRFTVQSSAQVKIIANPTGSRRNVEINTNDPGRTYCAPEWSDTKTRSNGQYIYLEGCVSGTGTVELRRSSDNALLRTYTSTIRSATAPTTTPTSTPTSTPVPTATPTQPPSATASLSPDPSTVNFQPDGSWRRFTVNSTGSIRVYTNPGSTPLNVEVYTSSTSNHCGNGAEREYKSRGNGQSVYLAGCQSGTGTVQLQTSSGTVIRTYTFSIGSGGGTNPTPTSTPTSTPTNTPTPIPTQPPTPVPTQPPTPTPSPPTAEFDPHPRRADMRSDGAWHRFEMDSNEEIKVVVNPRGSELILKIAETNDNRPPSDNWCDSGAPKRRNKTLDNDNDFFLSACADGIATIHLESTSTRQVIRTYSFRVGPGSQPTATPTITPVPTPNPIPTTPPCPSSSSGGTAVGQDVCPLPPPPNCDVTDAGDLTSIGAGSAITEHDNWVSGCQKGSGSYKFFRHYRFSVNKGTHLSVDVSGNSTIELRKGTSTSGGSLANGSSISRTLTETGTYTLTLWGRNPGNFTMNMKGRIPWLGHQKDNTVKYSLDTMPVARTSPQPTNPVPDPATLIPAITDEAARQWNLAARSNPGLLVCKDHGSTNDCIFNGTDRNTDNKDVIVNALPGDNTGLLHRKDAWVGSVLGSNHCGKSYACVKPRGFLSSLQFVTKLRWLPFVSDHLQNLTMVIEEPAWSYSDSTGRFTGRLWTDSSGKHLAAVNPSERADIPGLEQSFAYTWIYARGVMMHEFGHTAGLTDLYHLTGYSGYLMDTNYDETSIPSRDKAYIRQVYHNHSRH